MRRATYVRFVRELMPPPAFRNACALAVSGLLHALVWLAYTPEQEPPGAAMGAPLRVSLLLEEQPRERVEGNQGPVTTDRPAAAPFSANTVAPHATKGSPSSSNTSPRPARASKTTSATPAAHRPATPPGIDRASTQTKQVTEKVKATTVTTPLPPADPATSATNARTFNTPDTSKTQKPLPGANIATSSLHAAESAPATMREPVAATEAAVAISPTEPQASASTTPEPVTADASPASDSVRAADSAAATRRAPVAAPEAAVATSPTETAASASTAPAPVTADASPETNSVHAAESAPATLRAPVAAPEAVVATSPTERVAPGSTGPAPVTAGANLATDSLRAADSAIKDLTKQELATAQAAPDVTATVAKVSEANPREPALKPPAEGSVPQRAKPAETTETAENAETAKTSETFREKRARGRGPRQGAWVTFVRTEGVGDATSDPNATAIGDRNVRVDAPSRALTNTTRGLGDTPTARDLLPLDPSPLAAENPTTAPSSGAPPSPSRLDGLGLAGTRDEATPTPRPPAARTLPTVTLPGAQPQVATRSAPTMNAIARPGGAAVALIDEPAPRGVVATPAPGPQGRPSAAVPALAGATPPRPSPSEAAPAIDAKASASMSVLATVAATEERIATTTTLARDAEPMPGPTPAPETAPAREAEEAGPTRPAATWSDLAVVAETVPVGERTQVAVRDDPIGHWMVGVDDAIRAGWRYPAAAQVGGVEGNVVVTFRVKRSGKVVDAQIVSGSGDPYLDMAALVAVPDRVPPLPKKAPRSVEIRYIFRYRAP